MILDYVHKEHEKRYPDRKIVGWQHTHPNYGIFLSNYDTFIQENFFNLPFQIAYVIDPIQNLRGFFQWKNGRIEKLKGFYVYDEVGKPIKIEQTKVKKEEKPAKPSRGIGILLALLCIATVCLSCFAFSLQKKYEAQLAMQEEILSELSMRQTEIMLQKAEIQTQKNEISAQNGLIAEQGAQLAALANQDADGEVHFRAYTVTLGDNLSAICEKNNLDYAANKNIILAINGIENADKILVGQTILLPIAE